MSLAFVLSGGGAKGSFQVGALRFLYARNVRPDIICGCSVGSINGIKLAEGEGAPAQGMQGLERIWFQLHTSDDMFLREEWLNQLPEEIRNVILDIEGGGLNTSLFNEGDYSAWGDIAFLPLIIERGIVAGTGFFEANNLRYYLKLITEAKSVFNLQPIEWKLNGNPEKGIRQQLDLNLVRNWVQAGKKLRLAVVSLESGKLRYVTEEGYLLERDNYAQVMLPTQLHPACAPLKDEIEALAEQRNLLQEDLEAVGPGDKASVAAAIKRLNAEIGQKTLALGECKRLHPAPGRPAQVGLTTGVLASASIPALFRAISMEGETYVDGGMREVLPLQAAIDLGAHVVYAIDASSPDVQPKSSFQYASWLKIFGRSFIDLSINEVSRNDQNPVQPGHQQIIGIQPTFDIHGLTDIEPGLIRIAMGYGYMCASDVIDGKDLEQRQSENWVEDGLPDGAEAAGDEPWAWVTADPAPISGSQAHKSALKSGPHQHFFDNARPMPVGPHDVLFAYTFLDPQHPPSQLMLQWNDGTWEHRAYWGQSIIALGAENTPGRRYMGKLPPIGRWVQLVIPANLVGLEGRAVKGMAFTLCDGQACWDVAGRRVGISLRGRGLSDRIARLRQQIRQEEIKYFRSVPPAPDLLQQIQVKKTEVRALVMERLQLGLDMPPHIEKAWMNWEWFAPSTHPDQPWPALPPASAVPAVCQPILDEINELQEEVAGLDELLDKVTTAEKPGIISQINKIKARITQRESDLEACVRQNTAPQPLDPVRHGLLLKGSGPEIYLLLGGSKLWIRSGQAFQDMGYQGQNVLQVSDDVLARFPQDRPQDGTLLNRKNDPNIYVMDGGQRRHIASPAVLDRDAPLWDNSWPHVRLIPVDTLTAIPAGPVLT